MFTTVSPDDFSSVGFVVGVGNVPAGGDIDDVPDVGDGIVGARGGATGTRGEGSEYQENMPDTCRSRALCHIL